MWAELGWGSSSLLGSAGVAQRPGGCQSAGCWDIPTFSEPGRGRIAAMTWPQKSHCITSATSVLQGSYKYLLGGSSGAGGQGSVDFISSSGNGKILEDQEGSEILLLL